MTVEPTRARVAALDILRFIAAASVMCYHLTFRSGGPSGLPVSPIESVTRYGYLGVDLFFLISGFVICWSAREGGAARFVRSRIIRLFPEFWLAVPLSVAVFILVPGGFGEQLTLRDVALNFTMVPQYLGARYVDGVYWTLGAEIKFYALLFLLLIIRQGQRLEAALLLWIAAAAAATLTTVPGALRSVIIFPYGTLFAAGGLFHLVAAKGWSPLRAVGLVVGLLLAIQSSVANIGGFAEATEVTRAVQVTTGALVVAAFAAFAWIATRPEAVTSTRTTMLLGALTYPLYLLHNTGKELFLVRPWPLPSLVRVLLAFATAFTLAYVVMRLGQSVVRPRLRSAVDAVYRRLRLAS